ncbi:unknown [Antheraea pernyi nucleopolyhedrovirus]|uniref:Uncharacterized protein n=2 Tax=Antheraea pernyi nuclear polyhedrosis virus TaxID=161494 RepID=Q1HH88_NPVAP|nr:hypothetical protein APNV_p009 [Antheraea pernyi nucleopolyhedrovirus]AWD33674.1 hypothetical protein [Antheraea proylei nucleopolyhedrovirus]BBD50463.1 hypothetical protein [Antheraea yamamai nucleopolyhedrovirus]BBD50615.1 hypothetical protein [Samia cynthia nucleopolyhedrovirus]ABF50374.1 unknown [Antheraea pernyi nucleopolyhedrovirus]ABQ12237.1 unknown [Antheraea pernyi nucleopolyhedrovirus]
MMRRPRNKLLRRRAGVLVSIERLIAACAAKLCFSERWSCIYRRDKAVIFAHSRHVAPISLAPLNQRFTCLQSRSPHKRYLLLSR